MTSLDACASYVTFILAISTVYIITIITDLGTSWLKFSSGSYKDCGQLLDLLNERDPQTGLAGEFCITFANWGTDGFMQGLW